MQNVKKTLPLAAFCLYFLKVLIIPSGLAEAAVLLILGTTAAYFEFKSNDKKLQELNERIDNQQKDLESKHKDLEFLKSSIAGIKLSSGIRTMGNGR